MEITKKFLQSKFGEDTSVGETCTCKECLTVLQILNSQELINKLKLSLKVHIKGYKALSNMAEDQVVKLNVDGFTKFLIELQDEINKYDVVENVLPSKK